MISQIQFSENLTKRWRETSDIKIKIDRQGQQPNLQKNCHQQIGVGSE